MNAELRKGLIWAFCFAIIGLIWLLYAQFSSTPKIEKSNVLQKNIDEQDIAQLSQNLGKVGDVCVGTVELARFIGYNKDKTVSREFGFEKLLHKQGNEWQIQKPYFNIYQSKLEYTVKADQGNLHVESALSVKPAPKDAKFTGNVVISIKPKGSSNIGNSTIFLDDINYIADKNMFTSAGSIKLESQKARMTGRGFELVYNQETGKLEYFKINKLDKCVISLDRDGTPFSSKDGKPKSDSNHKEGDVSSVKENNQLKNQPRINDGQYYRCVLKGNVVIETDTEIAFADEVSIDEILFNEKNDKNEAIVIDPNKQTAKSTNIEHAEKEGQTVSSETSADEVNTEVNVRCDGGIMVVPHDFVSDDFIAESNSTKSAEEFVTDKTKAVCIAKTINFHVITNEIILKSTSLWMKQPDENGTARKYLLSAPNLNVLFAKDNEKVKDSIAPDIKSLNASGRTVKMAYVKLSGNELFGGVEMKSQKLVFDGANQIFTAQGPGVIKVDNSKIAAPAVQKGTFSFQKPCYALVRDFAELKYDALKDELISDADAGKVLNIDYVSMLDGKEDKRISATANHIDAKLKELENNKTELAALNAKGGVTYDEESEQKKAKSRGVQLIGSSFTYDAHTSILTLKGDQNRMAFFNGTKVDGVEYNLDTGKVKIEKIGPGSLR